MHSVATIDIGSMQHGSWRFHHFNNDLLDGKNSHRRWFGTCILKDSRSANCRRLFSAKAVASGAEATTALIWNGLDEPPPGRDESGRECCDNSITENINAGTRVLGRDSKYDYDHCSCRDGRGRQR